MDARTAVENPGQSGWASPDAGDAPEAAAARAAEQAKRQEEWAWETANDVGGNYPGVNPAQDQTEWAVADPGAAQGAENQPGAGRAAMIARVLREPGAPIVGARVILRNARTGASLRGNVVDVIPMRGRRMFLAQWSDGQQTLEDTANYQVVLPGRKEACSECGRPF